jgi:lysine 6-dehydrogenase
MKIIIFGGGMQGCVIARNLLSRQEKPTVIIADIREPATLPTGATFSQCNVLDAVQVAALVKDADAVALAVPSQISYQALKNLIMTGVAIVDVSFTPDPPLDLHELAKKTGSSCVVDCGVAPGLSHILVGAAYAELGGLDQAKILVGGIPQEPPKTFKHAVYFNPHDLLAEYVRPARARKNKKDIAPPPLDVPVEIYQDQDLGKLEAFLSDGLRSLLTTFPDVPNMAELTLRWPGHLTMMQSLRDMGLLDAPETLSSIASTLGAHYPASAYPDVLVMVVEASRGDKHMAWRLIDRRLHDESAMSRTTAYTTAAMTMVLARKQFTQPGVYVPENVGSYGNLADIIIDDLRQNGIDLAVLETAAMGEQL